MKSLWQGVDGEGEFASIEQQLFILNIYLFRLLAPAAAIRRTIIRHLILLLDLSAAMMDRDMRPTRFDLTLQYAREFIAEWFDQNPLGQIGVVGMRAGIGERIGELSGIYICLNVILVPVPFIISRQATHKMFSNASPIDTSLNQLVSQVCKMQSTWLELV